MKPTSPLHRPAPLLGLLASALALAACADLPSREPRAVIKPAAQYATAQS